MNFEVHNINLQKRVSATNAESITSFYVTHQKEQVNAEDQTRKYNGVKAEASRQQRIKRRTYELPLL